VIEGDGFFQVLLPDGTIAYTRDGSFKLDAQGRIVTSNGFPIEPEIAITEEDALDISISSDGTVTILIAGQSKPAEKDSFELVRFVNNAGLKSIGQNLFTATGRQW